MNRRIISVICLGLSTWANFVFAQKLESLVPTTPSSAPDYFCTWNIQGYLVNYESTELQRREINEANIFGQGKYQNWANFFPRIRQDLYFVMDDSWDIPANENSSHNPYLGTAQLNEERFPTLTGTPSERLRSLVQKFKLLGWKGVGGWICAQRSTALTTTETDEITYWSERLKEANEAGFSYWKVDWGNHSHDGNWREMLTNLGKHHAPNLWIEHAMRNEFIQFSDVYRTYDVENIIAKPVTIQRVCNLLPYKANESAKGIINCEDEPYIAVGLGCAIGIMRHPYSGNMPNGQQDFVFPPVGQNYKLCMDEVIRAIRWHRIAEPFGVDGNFYVDSIKLNDTWQLARNETWQTWRPIGSTLTESAPARVSRCMPLPIVEDTCSSRPFILASLYPNQAIALSAIGRTLGRDYIEHPVIVTIHGKEWTAPIGLYGYFKEVSIIYPYIPKKKVKVIAQDLAGDHPIDIARKVRIEGNRLIIPGKIIKKIGLMNATPGDLSAPGMVIKMM